MSVRPIKGDCIRTMRLMVAAGIQVDSIVTDPPYHLTSIVKRFGATNAAPVKPGKTGAYKRASAGFMGKTWDGGDIAADPETWKLCLALLKPGGHMVAFGGTRTYHRMVTAIEDAGFEIRDQLAWMFGSGFPKSHDVSKGIDRAAGIEREVLGISPNWRESKRDREKFGSMEVRGENAGQLTAPATDAAREWEGWGTALKPAWETICLARKPLSEKSIAANVLRHGTGAINVDGCRVEGMPESTRFDPAKHNHDGYRMTATGAETAERASPAGRWPANLVHDGSDEVVGAFPSSKSCNSPSDAAPQGSILGGSRSQGAIYPGEDGSAARFFYSAKAGPDDRYGSKHPTVKPVSLMRWLARLITPPGGLILDPFAGTGTTGIAAIRESMRAILIEREPEYYADINRRLAALDGSDQPLFSGEPEQMDIEGALP